MNGGVMYLAELQAVKATISKTIIVLGPTLGMIPRDGKSFSDEKRLNRTKYQSFENID